MHIIPFGDRLLVKRKIIGEKIGKAGILFAPDITKDRETDLAKIVYIPEHSFADKELIENSQQIISSLIIKAKDGNSEALKALLEYNIFLKIKSLKIGDEVLISKYVGLTFFDNKNSGNLTLVDGSDVIGFCTEED